MDDMVLETQKWLNSTYGKDARFVKIGEDGKTGWATINGLIRALQIELAMDTTADNFGEGTEAKFSAQYPHGIKQQPDTDPAKSNVYTIIQGALWCKGYSVGEHLSPHFYSSTGKAIQKLKSDMGTGGDSKVDLEIMKALLSMQQFVLVPNGRGTQAIRKAQQQINRKYRTYTGIVPCDGIYSREMNTALIKVLQALEGFSPAEATGNFGDGTKARLVVINGKSAAAHPEWMWLATVSLSCNGEKGQVSDKWSSGTEATIRSFQQNYALPESGEIDLTTWMSLLTSKGDPDRKAIACDTRFELTNELIAKLKADGFQIVGRYLTEPGQADLKPEDYFKAIRPGELERITAAGMKFFPIFQENSRKLTDFTAANGARHAHEAREAALALGIPSTYIYFAVDMDVYDYQIDTHIKPYFQSILANLGGGYRVGIYASRNVCTEIITAGLAGSAFVSDMSSGFSGNLGFPIPKSWNYDQFTEISGYGGKWDLDKVAYSGRHSAVSYVSNTNAGGPEVDSRDDYTKLSPIDLIWHLEKRFEELRKLGKVGNNYHRNPDGSPVKTFVHTHRALLNYLAKRYLADGTSKNTIKWAIAAEAFRKEDAAVIERDSIGKKIIAALHRYTSERNQVMIDISGGQVDVSHLAVTIIGYMNTNAIPDKWTGWAGDLASAMKSLQLFKNWNPKASLSQAATSLVGMDERYLETPGLAGKVVRKGEVALANSCNFSDLCTDGDAIALRNVLVKGEAKDPHLLSSTMRKYYNDISALKGRFKQIALSIEARTITEASKGFLAEQTGTANSIIRNELSEAVEPEVIQEACNSLARFIFA